MRPSEQNSCSPAVGLARRPAAAADVAPEPAGNIGLFEQVAPSPAPPLYRIRNLTLARGSDFRLTIDELEIHTGEKLAIVGHNGSGKTTLLRILARLATPASAQVFEHPRDLRPGFLRQQPYLFHESVARNLAYPLRLRHLPRGAIAARVTAMLERLDLQALADRPAQQLSGGERKRLALGRVLIADPEILFLDEPDAHLDRHSSDVIARTLTDLPLTLVLTTHDLPFAHRIARRIVHLRDGRIIPGLPVNNLIAKVAGDVLKTQGGLEIHFGQADLHDQPQGGQDPRPAGEIDVAVTRIAIDPRNIVLSPEALDSSMRNQFRGRIASVRDHDGTVWLEVAVAGELLTAIISRASYERLAFNVNREVVVSFKAQAVETW
ncbi:MAG: ATP-binding cassette domain-containing protein [Candidatus Eisenbacteria sp.]|nr:ATP-binding cassette domain-containing protein [Candidatus Eisenbacteria bacterium]